VEEFKHSLCGSRYVTLVGDDSLLKNPELEKHHQELWVYWCIRNRSHCCPVGSRQSAGERYALLPYPLRGKVRACRDAVVIQNQANIP
jgi:hypothetical protein